MDWFKFTGQEKSKMSLLYQTKNRHEKNKTQIEFNIPILTNRLCGPEADSSYNEPFFLTSCHNYSDTLNVKANFVVHVINLNVSDFKLS